MPTTAERLGIVETKVHGLDEKMDELKVDVKDLHDCLDKTRDDLTTQLKTMYDASCLSLIHIPTSFVKILLRIATNWTREIPKVILLTLEVSQTMGN